MVNHWWSARSLQNSQSFNFMNSSWFKILLSIYNSSFFIIIIRHYYFLLFFFIFLYKNIYHFYRLIFVSCFFTVYHFSFLLQIIVCLQTKAITNILLARSVLYKGVIKRSWHGFLIFLIGKFHSITVWWR